MSATPASTATARPSTSVFATRQTLDAAKRLIADQFPIWPRWMRLKAPNTSLTATIKP
jgi:hypothetical protein